MIDPLELHAYADGELERESEERIRRQLQSDPDSSAEVSSIQSLKGVVARLEAVECRREWKACVGRLDELDKIRRTESFVGRYAWALCGVIFLFILAGGITTRLAPSTSMASSDLARAVASLGPTSRPSSQQPAEVRQWLDRLVGRASDLISPEGLVVLGANSGEVDGYRVSQIELRDNAGDLALVVINADMTLGDMPSTTDARFRAGQLQGVNCLAWNDGGYTLVLAANRPYDQLAEAAKNIIIKPQN
jgi:anti-sigma factor RsiW